ncbi:MAG TPA: ABC transporter permease [Thermoanaerobaculia bacterium]
MSSVLRDVRYAARVLARSRGFAAAAVITLALGTGANAAIFSVVNAVLLRPLPFPAAGELVRITADLKGQDLQDAGLSAPELFDYRDRAGAFAAVSGLFPINANIVGVGRPERAEVLLVDTGYFDLLGVRARLGRTFTPEDFRPGIAEVAVVSDGWWRRHGADPEIVGRRFRLDDDLYTVIGVAPAGFRHPGRGIETEVDVWSPAGWSASPFPAPNRRSYFLRGALARLKPGVTAAAAQASLDRLAATLRREYGSDYPATDGWAPRVVPLQQDLVGNVRPALLVLTAAVGLVLLIACANVANLLLARAASRQREIAVRRALGAGRWRLIRQLLTESVVLAVAGGGLGLAVASWGTGFLARVAPPGVLRPDPIGVDARVLLFALALSIGTGLVFGAAPALSLSGAGREIGLRPEARGTTSRRGHRVRGILVVAEFALALMLLVAAGLLVRTLGRLQRVDPGFDPRRVTTATLWLPQPNIRETGRYFKNAARVELCDRILDRAARLPGVESAALATAVPFGANRFVGSFTIEGRDPDRSGTGSAELSSVTVGYFDTMGIPLERGRAFTPQDAEASEPIAIASASLARRYFADEDPIGRRVRLATRTGQGPWLRIVGIVRDVKTQALDVSERPLLYRPMAQASNLSLTLVLRGDAAPSALAPSIERDLAGIDPEVPVYGVRAMESALSATVRARRFAMLLLGLFAALALVLSAVGVYGLLAYSVAQRRSEIGIRVALGARPADVRRLFLRQGAILVAAGVVLGLLGAAAATRGLAALLFGVSPRDPATFAVLTLLLSGVALTACWLPARRAARVDPVGTLRAE